ncbi:MAG: class I tRNA ligase family protein, partial [Thermoguttaceae bacterium]
MIESLELPKQYDPAAAQEKWGDFWNKKKFFESRPNPDKKPYCIVIPPPNVTGALHLGHALNNTLQDIMVRMKRMQGFEALWIPGVDHAGIATQAVVERKLFENEKKTRHDIGRDALVQRIWDWKEQYQARIIQQLQEMGCSCDWSRTRFTLDDICARAVRHFFFGLFEKGRIYRGKRLVNWDTHLQTAVSDDEVFHETVAGNFWYIQYAVISPKPGEPNFVTVATTRPETMLADTAVAVHPDPESALDKIIIETKIRLESAPEKEKAELAAELESYENRKNSDILQTLKSLAKMAKEGRQLMLPLANRPIPLLADQWAKPEKGTGCVKITPAHDQNDYEVGLRHSLPMINLLNKNGTLNENAGLFAGLTIPKARKAVVDALKNQNLLESVEERIIELAHSDRSKTPIEPFLNDQWFVQMNELAQSAIDAVNQNENDDAIHIVPARYKKGYIDWLAEKRDWPIGRQLWWGHRIPIWYCPGGEMGASEDLLKKTFDKRNDVCWIFDAKNSVWWICSQESDLHKNDVPGFELIQEEDVLDTWFSSALWPHSTLGWPADSPELSYYYPTSVLITNRDIMTLWVARMVLAGLFNTAKKPFDEVYIHPKILDKYGEGMSKSKGNGVDPLSVIAKFGADALRFALAYLTTENQDIRLTLDFECPHCKAVVEQTKKNRILPKILCPKCKLEFRTQWAQTQDEKSLPEGAMIGERFEVARNFCNKLWNAARFVLLNSKENDENCENNQNGKLQKEYPSKQTEYLEDAWILSKLASVTKEVTACFEHYRFADAMRILYDFSWDEFCSFYVEMVKSRLDEPEKKQQALAMLHHVLGTLVRLLHPVTPFVTEEIWQRLREYDETLAESITVASWPIAEEKSINAEIESQFAVFQELLRAIRDVRASRNIPPKTEIAFSVRCDAQTAALLKPMTTYFASMAKANGISWGPNVSAPPLAATVALSGMDLFVDLAGLIDVSAETVKLEKELA